MRLAFSLFLLLGQFGGYIPLNLKTDSFQRASLGGNWSNTVGNLTMCSSGLYLCANVSSSNSMYYTARAWADDQVSEITLGPIDFTKGIIFTPRVRRTETGARTSYECDRAYAGAVFDRPGDPDEIFIKRSADSNAGYIAFQALAYTPAAGDRITLEVTGQNPVSLVCYLNGSPAVSGTDSSAFRVLSGSPGVAGNTSLPGKTAATLPAITVSSWAAWECVNAVCGVK